MGDLRPSIRALLDQLRQAPVTDFGSLNTTEKIATYLEGARRPAARPRMVDIDVVENLVVGERDVPVYFHGGGWVIDPEQSMDISAEAGFGSRSVGVR
jgi:hypothetical protein